MTSFKPMLAFSKTPDFKDLRFPLVASPKLDGIRCVVREGRALTRALKPIPNKALRERLEQFGLYEGLDGELILDGGTFQETTSAVMSHETSPELLDKIFFHVFDHTLEEHTPFATRFWRASLQIQSISSRWHGVKAIPHTWITSPIVLAEYEAQQLALGFEGIMLRDPKGPYKFGRSTLKEGWLLKVKRFEDAEAVVTGFEELMVNGNAQERNELDLAKRSSSKAGLVPGGTLGAFVLRLEKRECPECGGSGEQGYDDAGYAYDCEACGGSGNLTFSCGSGLTEAQRADFWARRNDLIGAVVKFKHQPHGAKDAPRSPIFLGFRKD